MKSFLVETVEDNAAVKEGQDDENRSSDNKLQEVSKANLQKFEKQTSRDLENKFQEVSKTNCNKTNINKTEKSDTDISDTVSIAETSDKEETEKIIKQKIGYFVLLDEDSSRKENIDFIVEVMTDAVTGRKDLKINQTWISYEKIREKLLGLKKEHIEYALCVLKENTGKITHLRAYLLSILYNASINIAYYNRQSKANQNMENYVEDERLWQEFLKG